MCSVGDDIDENGEVKFMPAKQKVDLLESKCNKCREQVPCILLRGKDAYCKQCFLNGTVHKFKALLGKHRLINPKDSVLICHEPGHASAALLHFLRTGLDLETPKKLRFKPIFLFIDRYAFLSNRERNDLKENIVRQLKLFDFPVYFVSFYDYIKQSQNLKDLLTVNPVNCKARETDLDELKQIIELKANETTKNEILNIWKNQLVVAAAKLLNCKFVFTPELSVDIASQMLTSVSLGRGLHIAFDTGFCDSRDPEVKILRPLRVFEEKELVFYNIYNNIETVHIPIPQNNPFNSIQNLLHKFVNELQMNYPATVATVVRTGDKLTVHDDVRLNQTCQLCKVPVVDSTNELTARQATEISQWISNHSELEVANGISGSQLKLSSNLEEETTKQYCYSCSKLVGFINV